jgi:hypothetical protein
MLAAIPLQAYLFAKVIVIFNPPADLRSESNHWSLMWLILALGIGACYFIMGATATHVAHVSVDLCRSRTESGVLREVVCIWGISEAVL